MTSIEFRLWKVWIFFLQRSPIQLFLLRIVVFQLLFLFTSSVDVSCGGDMSTPLIFDEKYRLKVVDARFELESTCIELRAIDRNYRTTFFTSQGPCVALIELFEKAKKGENVDLLISQESLKILEGLSESYETKNNNLGQSLVHGTFLSHVQGVGNAFFSVSGNSISEVQVLEVGNIDRISSLSTSFEKTLAKGLKDIEHAKGIITQDYMNHERAVKAREVEALRLETYLKQCSKINRHYLRFLQSDSPYNEYFTQRDQIASRAQVLIELRRKTPVCNDVPLCIV